MRTWSCWARGRAATRPRSVQPISARTVALIERYPALGGVCLNVGCIPSKALLHMAKVITDAEETAQQGIVFGKPGIEIDKLRGWKDSVIGKLTKGLGATGEAAQGGARCKGLASLSRRT